MTDNETSTTNSPEGADTAAAAEQTATGLAGSNVEAAALSHLSCRPGGPSPEDAALAARIGPKLHGLLRGNLTPGRVCCARQVVEAAQARGLPRRAAVIAVTTTIVESNTRATIRNACRVLLLAGTVLSPPAALLAQPAAPPADRMPGPFRILNNTGADGMQLYVTGVGEHWGPSRLGQPLASGATLDLRARADGSCRFDARLVLADGREAVARDHDICALPMIAMEGPAAAGSGPRSPGLFRVENRTGADAMQFYIAAAGEPWGSNRLAQPLPADGSLLQRAGARAGCRFDVRLVLADGKEEVRRDQDVCALPTIVMGAAPPARPAEVAARPSAPPEVQPGPGSRTSSGSGFVVAAGRIMTNWHVVDRCVRLLVRAPDGRSFVAAPPAQVDVKLDLAVLDVPGLPGPALAFRSDPVRRGEGVVVFGYPLAGLLSSDPKLTRGEVNGLNGLRDDPDVFQISAPVQPGNSGGPLLDLHGHVLGVVVAKLNARAVAERTGDIAQNINFAVKGQRAAAFLQSAGVPFATSDSRGAERSTADVGDTADRSTVLVRCER